MIFSRYKRAIVFVLVPQLQSNCPRASYPPHLHTMVAISNLASLNFTQLAANAVEPAAGSNYHIQNLAFAHFLDNSNGVTSDGNPVVSGASSSASSQLVKWSYLLQEKSGP